MKWEEMHTKGFLILSSIDGQIEISHIHGTHMCFIDSLGWMTFAAKSPDTKRSLLRKKKLTKQCGFRMNT